MDDEKQMMTVRSLLAQLAVIAKKNREELEKSEWNFNVFRLCGVYHYENANSRILAEFLNPQGSHGLGSALLERFLSSLNIPFVVSGMTEVITELAMDKGRMDIVIRDHEHDWCVVIENKIYATEQEEQLPRYWNWLMANYREDNSRLLFLTLSGYDSETAEKAKTDGLRMCYAPVSYARNIVGWLNECIALSVERPFVRETLRQYRNHIKNLTGESMEEENKKEVVDLMVDADNFEAAVIVNNHYDEACQRIATDLFKDVMRKLADECEIAPDSEAPTQKTTNDGFRLRDLKTGAFIRIGPAHKGYSDFFVGMRNDDAKEYGDIVKKNMKDDAWQSTASWPAYKYLPDEFRLWHGELLLQCIRHDDIRRRMVDSIVSLVNELRAALKTD